MDDIEDDSQLRRGQPGMFIWLFFFRILKSAMNHPVAHKIYGIPQTINTANYVYFLAYQALFPLCRTSDEDDKPRMYNVKNLDQIVTCEFVRSLNER